MHGGRSVNNTKLMVMQTTQYLEEMKCARWKTSLVILNQWLCRSQIHVEYEISWRKISLVGLEIAKNEEMKCL